MLYTFAQPFSLDSFTYVYHQVKGPSAEFGSVSKLKATQQGSGIRPRMFLIKGNYEIKMKEVQIYL